MDQPLVSTPPKAAYKRIATEEAWAPEEMMRIWKKILDGPDPDPGFVSLIGFYMSSQAERPKHIMSCLTDLGDMRIRHMDEAGLDRQVIAQECEWEPDHDLRLVIENVALDTSPRFWLRPTIPKK